MAGSVHTGLTRPLPVPPSKAATPGKQLGAGPGAGPPPAPRWKAAVQGPGGPLVPSGSAAAAVRLPVLPPQPEPGEVSKMTWMTGMGIDSFVCFSLRRVSLADLSASD